MRLVIIEWLDSFGCSQEWQPLSLLTPEALRCRSVGWLKYDGKDCKIVVPHIATGNASCEPSGSGDMTIPTKAIVRMMVLREPGGKK